ncbi:hypothetical protein B0J17DRAFT_115778 [Rhizoctonia solani]|nr:hypothetical protein B0J17DRAFT_115778 [Rhizoctonia solani]
MTSGLRWKILRLIPSGRGSLLTKLCQRLIYFPVTSRHAFLSYTLNGYLACPPMGIKIRCSYFIELLSITYDDGVTSTIHGGGGHVGVEYEFTLARGEHITEMLIWIKEDWVFGLQFITNMGRCSDQYGIHYGTPRVARCKGGVLVGFLSHTKLHPEYKEIFHNVQGIWRHDLVPRVPKEDDVYSEYFGNIKQEGKNFNDRAIVGNSTSIRISNVEVWSGEQIDGIKVRHDLTHIHLRGLDREISPPPSIRLHTPML